jgi:hypothetical protein
MAAHLFSVGWRFGPYSRDRRKFAQLVRVKSEYDGIFFGIGIFIRFRRTPDVEAGVAAKYCPLTSTVLDRQRGHMATAVMLFIV